MNETIEKLPEEKIPDPINSTVDVEIGAGGYSARIYVHAPMFGGNEADKELVEDALGMKGVTYGIDAHAIDYIVLNKCYDQWYDVAACLRAQDGEDGDVEYLFDKEVSAVPKEDEHGFVNYKDLGTVRNIKQGTVVANIKPATPGTAGINVKNELIAPKAGIPPKVIYGDNITVTPDGLQMVVTADGNLVYKNGRFSVETVVRLSGDVDVSTGNIDFIGDVVIRGDVKEGFVVTSGKNITIQGGVFGAKITAVEKIVVRGGCIGSELAAGGSVEIEFAQNTSINCYESLRVKNLYYSDIFCKGDVYCNSGAGSVIGGKLVATKNLYATFIGSKSYTPTLIVIGDNAIMLQERTGLEQKIEQYSIEEEKATKVVEYLTQKRAELGGLPVDKQNIMTLAAKTILVARGQKAQMSKRIEEIDEYLTKKQNLFVECRKELYPGVKIIINDIVFTANTTYQYCRIGIGEDGVEVKNL